MRSLETPVSERFVVKAGAFYVKVTDEVRPYDKRRTSRLVSRRKDATAFTTRSDAVDFKIREEKEQARSEAPERVRISKIVRRPKAVWTCVCVYPPENHGVEGCVVTACPCLITKGEGLHRAFRGSGATAAESGHRIFREYVRAYQIAEKACGTADEAKARGYAEGLGFALKTLGIRS